MNIIPHTKVLERYSIYILGLCIIISLLVIRFSPLFAMNIVVAGLIYMLLIFLIQTKHGVNF